MFRQYYRLTKPGIIYGNLLSAIGGFLLAAHGHINFKSFLAMAIGSSLIIGSACVFNNIIDRDIDKNMKRTRNRSMVIGEIPLTNALAFGAVLGITGVNIIARLTNRWTLILGLVGFILYVGPYTYSKRKTAYSTLIGSIPGAMPIAAGYTAASNHFNAGAQLLLLIMIIWQMPHFYAIGMFRRDDYAAAGLPILPVVRGFRETKLHFVVYIFLYVVANAVLALLGYASFSFFLVMTGIGLYWLWLGLRGFKTGTDDIKWARRMFGWSLIVLLVFCLMLSIDAWLP